MKKLLILCAALTASTTLANDPKNADAKIEAALSANRITRDQAWSLKMKARFAPSDLPTEYRPDPAVATAELDHVMPALAAAMPTLGAATQKELVGYFIPPAYAGSKLALLNGRALEDPHTTTDPNLPAPLPQSGWKFIESIDFKVWWDESIPDGEARARRVLAIAVHSETKLRMLTGKRLLSDAGTHRFRMPNGEMTVWGDGGNGKFDIYIGGLSGALALTVPYPLGCSERPSFMLIRTSMTGDDRYAQLAVAHEMMHVFQNLYVRGYDCDKYTPVDEGTAHWAVQYIYPNNNLERERNSFYQTAQYSLADWSYDTWPFYLFMERTLGADKIADVFENYALSVGMEAVNQALPGGFEKQWPLYPIHEWNQTDVVDDFRDWDDLQWKPRYNQYSENVPVLEVKPDEKGNFLYETELMLKPLTRSYFHFKFNSSAMRAIRFGATLGFEPTRKGRLKVLVKRIGQEFVQEDWSEKKFDTELCRDLPDEKIEEVVLIYSNVDYPREGNAGQTIETGFYAEATNLGCNRLKGSFEVDMLLTDGGTLRQQISTKSEVTFEREGLNDEGNFIGRFKAVEGNGTLHYNGRISGSGGSTCTASGSFPFLVAKTRPNTIGMSPHQVRTPNNRIYSGAVAQTEPPYIMITHTCSQNQPPIVVPVVPLVWNPMGMQRANNDGTMTGTAEIPLGNGGYQKSSWSIYPLTSP